MATNTDAVPSLTSEQIEALKAAALAATPQDIDGSQKIEIGIDGQKYIACPHCGGEGNVELEADYCNYDGAAIGVQFYGIGNAHGAAEAYLRAANPSNVLALIERLERAEAALLSASKPAAAQVAPSNEDAALIERLRLLASGDGVLIKSALALTTIGRAIQRLAASPAAPAQSAEPVTWALRIGDSPSWAYMQLESDVDFYGKQSGLKYEKRPLYAAPQSSQPVEAGETYVRLFRASTGDVFKALRTDSAGIADLLREGWEISPSAVVLDDERAALPDEVREALTHEIGGWRGAACGTRDDEEGERRSADYNRRAQVIEDWLARAASPQPVAQTANTYTTQAGESVMGIALRQCGNEAEWRRILACNPAFADMLPHEYFPVGTILTLPAAAQPAGGDAKC